MNNLINFFYRFHSFFLFTFLEVAAIYMMVNYNDFHNKVYVNSSNVVSGYLTKRYDNISDYFHLRTINDSLASAYNEYLNRQPNAYYDHTTTSQIVEDTIHQKMYNYISAKIINNSTDSPNNTLTLNRGSRHGIQKDAGILCNGSIAGIVLTTSKNYSVAMSLLHRDARVNAKFKSKNGYFGTLVWKGTDPRVMTLENIPRHARIAVGDTIVTNNYSDIFPADIMIGTVLEHSLGEGSSYHDVDIKLSTDFSNIEYVNVVEYLMRDERRELEASVKGD